MHRCEVDEGVGRDAVPVERPESWCTDEEKSKWDNRVNI